MEFVDVIEARISLSNEVRAHPSSSCTACPETAACGVARSMRSATSSTSWHGTLPDVAAPPTRLATSASARLRVIFASFIEALDLDHPHVLGLSWGGGLALERYRTAPTLPRSLVLSGAYTGCPAGALPPDIIALRLDAYLTAAQTPPHEALRSWGPGMFSEAAPDESSRSSSRSRRTTTRKLWPTSRDRSPPPTSGRPPDDHGADTRPARRLGCAVTSGRRRRAAQRDPAIGARRPRGVGHVSNIEAPERFNHEVRKFLTLAKN